MIGQAEFFITPQGTQHTYGACIITQHMHASHVIHFCRWKYLGSDFLNDQNNEEAGKSLKKFTSAYLFQIAWDKSCDYLLIKYMKKFEMV